jgi:L-lactate dehydrogenase (cytochrome)
MNDVEEVDTRTTFLGHETSLPVSVSCHLRRTDAQQIFICPCGMAKLSHPEGEALLAKGAGQCGIIQFVSRPNLLSLTTDLHKRVRTT